MPSGSTARQTSTLAIRPIGAPLTPTTKSRGRTSQAPFQSCPGQQSLSSTSSSSTTITPSTSSAIAGPAHHETYLQHGGVHQPQPMEIGTSLSIERSSLSSFISWQDSSATEQHHLARYPGFWSQDGYQGFWGHPPPMPIQHRRDHPYRDRPDQHRQQQHRGDRQFTTQHQFHQQLSLETIREEQVPSHHREREQRHQPEHSRHHRAHQQEGRQQQHQSQTWHGWHYHPRQLQQPELDIASQRPIGAGREWDSYILRRQQHQLTLERSSSQTSASTWARQQDGGHRVRIHLNIFHLEASWHVATWSSSSTKMSAIILPGDPVDHHDLIPDILSQTITYILNINQPRVELRSHLAAALHAVPPGVAHQSQNNIKVVTRHLDQQPSPKRHHQELIQYLKYHIREHRAFVGHAVFTIEDTYTLLATACQCYIEQLPPVPSTRATRHRAQEESTSSSSTSSSNIEHRGPQLHVGMICIKDHSEKDHRAPTSRNIQSSSRPKVVYDITGEELTSHIEYDIKNENPEEIELTSSSHHHVPRHRIVYNIFGQPHLELPIKELGSTLERTIRRRVAS